jgi:hypothetical protein
VKTRLLIATLLAAFAIAGCNHQLAFDVSLKPTLSPATTQELTLASFASALGEIGYPVSLQGSVEQPFLSVAGKRLEIDGGGLQVYEYDDSEAARLDAARIGPDASTVEYAGTPVTISWIAAPHVYQKDRLIVVYVGGDPALLSALESTLGAPYAAGRSLPIAPL